MPAPDTGSNFLMAEWCCALLFIHVPTTLDGLIEQSRWYVIFEGKVMFLDILSQLLFRYFVIKIRVHSVAELSYTLNWDFQGSITLVKVLGWARKVS